jgi:hypothetical protein
VSYGIGLESLEEVKALELRIKQLMVSALVAEDIYDCQPSLDVSLMFRPEYLARQLTACLRVPAQVLQEDRVLDHYPDGLWQHIRAKLGWKYRRKEVRLTEWLVYPTVEVPEQFTDTVRLYVQPRFTYFGLDTGDDDQ